jgi:acyl-CoA synthetase (AMP-forming)/AMP-acid ligase II
MVDCCAPGADSPPRTEGTEDLLEAYYGVPEAGGVLLALNVRLAAQELAYVLNNSGAKVLFFEREFVEVLPKTGTGKLLKRELRKKYWPQP